MAILDDAFRHHVWATRSLIDWCAKLPPEELEATVDGTYGSILDTLRHIVGGDAWYLHVLSGQQRPLIDEEAMDLADLRGAVESQGAAWDELLGGDLDPSTDVVAVRDDGTRSHAPLSIRLAQALHHGSDHRSQVCTILSTLGKPAPEYDVWAFGRLDGRVFEEPARS